jgi:hypothetical protein
MMQKVAAHATKRALIEREINSQSGSNNNYNSADKKAMKARKTLKNYQINLEYIEGTLQRIF